MSYPDPQRGFFLDEFWSYVDDGELRLQQCPECGDWQYPPAATCNTCLSLDLDWTEVSGAGTIYSYVVFHRQYFPAYDPPHVVVSVELDEGPLFMGTMAEAGADDVAIGDRVAVTLNEISADLTLPEFELR